MSVTNGRIVNGASSILRRYTLYTIIYDLPVTSLLPGYSVYFFMDTLDGREQLERRVFKEELLVNRREVLLLRSMNTFCRLNL